MQPSVHWMLDQEARALLHRLNRVKPFVLTEPMLPAASLLPPAQVAIERFLAKGRHELKTKIGEFQSWLIGDGAAASPEEVQKRFTFLRLRFNAVLTQLDLFSDVITQRSESENGVWLSGLDVVSADALAMPEYYRMPPVVCYLDRGIGAVIRVPRERMIGSGIASSLVHEVGHQGLVLLGLIPSLRPVLQEQGRKSGGAQAWQLFDRWISEILADFWSIARVGVVSTLGLIGVVSLPRPFVFRLNVDDPHPMPWLRVKLSCAIGKALYPHRQWQAVAEMWESFYPLAELDEERHGVIAAVEAVLPQFIELLAEHRPKSLRGKTLREAMETGTRQPARLAALFKDWVQEPAKMYRESPALAFAVLGQAKMDNNLSPEDEADLLAKLLNYWAMRSTLDMSGVLHELTYDAGTSVY